MNPNVVISILGIILFGIGGVEAQLQSRLPVGTAPGSVEVADLNADGMPDLVVANEQSGNVTIMLGSGAGHFSEAKGSPFPAGTLPNDIAIGDYSGDGKPDIAVANHDEKYLTILLGDGAGGFTPAPGTPLQVDVRPHVHGVGAGDLDGDGNLDLVTDDWANDQVAVFFGIGKAHFRTPGVFLKVGKRPYQRLRVADLNGDGKADVVTTNSEGNNVTVMLSDGKHGFKEASGSPFASGDSPFNLAVGDVNGDGALDLAVVNSPGSMAYGHGKGGLTVLLGNGRGGFAMTPDSPHPAGRIPNRVATGDLNGDGLMDVAVTCPDENTVTLFQMNRGGTVDTRSTIVVTGKPKGVAIQDLNGDGKADIVITNNADNTVSVILRK